jgi:predicted ester cyclase
VAVHCTFEATHVGEWEGIAPTGKRITTRGMALCRLVDGKIVEDEVNYGEDLRAALARAEAAH